VGIVLSCARPRPAGSMRYQGWGLFSLLAALASFNIRFQDSRIG